MVGAPECGDVMKLQVKVNPATGVIDDAKFKTFGCGSAIASSSLATEWLKGKTVDQALAIKNTDIVAELSLPPVKIHCSVLAEDAIKAAIADYKAKQEKDKGVPASAGHAQPNVLNLASSMTPVSGLTLTCSFITSPHSGAPTMPVPTSGLLLSSDPTLRGWL